MSLESNVMALIKNAMKEKNETALRALRAVKAALLEAKTASNAEQIDEKAEAKIIQRMIKQRKDAAAIFNEQNRGDLAKIEEEEMAVLEQFLPKQLTDAELETAIQTIINQVNAKSPADIGKVMGVASKSLAGQAEGAAIAQKVKQLLNM